MSPEVKKNVHEEKLQTMDIEQTSICRIKGFSRMLVPFSFLKPPQNCKNYLEVSLTH